MEINEKSEVNSFYVILSGFFKYHKSKIIPSDLYSQYHHWKNRIFDGNYTSTFEYLNQNYYDTYLNNAFPEIRADKGFTNNFSQTLLNHLTLKDIDSISTWSLKLKNEELPFTIEYADIFLYPSEIGIFSFKCTINKSNLTVSDISNFTNSIRNLTSTIKSDETTLNIKEFTEKYLLKNISFNKEWNLFNPQLKSYIQVDLKDEINEDELNYLLFDIGNVSPLGSAKGKGIFAPHKSYYNEQLKHNQLTVFNNWTTLSLYDTFTRISINFADQFKSWEYDYFNIYIHCLFLKFYMYLTNTTISDVTVINKKTEKIRDNFIEFINDYYHSHISYKFLPDLIQDKLIYSLEIQSEIEKMEMKIKRINEHALEGRQKMMNLVLLVITLLSVISLIHDFSNYMVHMGASSEKIYPTGSIIIGIALITSLAIFFRLKLKK